MPLTDWELWACAAKVERQYGDQAPVFVAARLGTLALLEDDKGVKTWQEIAARIDKMTRSAPQSTRGIS